MKQYYVAVGCAQSKLVTLLDFLQAVVAEASRDLIVGVCCSSRDSCDEVIAALIKATHFKVACWHADMLESEMRQIGRLFIDGNISLGDGSVDAPMEDRFVHPDDVRDGRIASRPAVQPYTAHVLVSTDAALRSAPAVRSIALQDGVPIQADLLLNYDLPSHREQHLRRIHRILSPDAAVQQCAVIHFVAAGQIALFRTVEKFANAMIFEMPVHAAEILPDTAARLAA